MKVKDLYTTPKKKKRYTSTDRERAVLKYIERNPGSGPNAISVGTGLGDVSKVTKTLKRRGWVKDMNANSHGESFIKID